MRRSNLSLVDPVSVGKLKRDNERGRHGNGAITMLIDSSFFVLALNPAA